jgi:hypothetical protein
MIPDGVEVGGGIVDFDETIRLRKETIQLPELLFEAVFSATRLVAKHGLLQRGRGFRPKLQIGKVQNCRIV